MDEAKHADPADVQPPACRLLRRLLHRWLRRGTVPSARPVGGRHDQGGPRPARPRRCGCSRSWPPCPRGRRARDRARVQRRQRRRLHFVTDSADRLNVLGDLTTFEDGRSDVRPAEYAATKTLLVNWGIAALVYLVVGKMLDRIIRP